MYTLSLWSLVDCVYCSIAGYTSTTWVQVMLVVYVLVSFNCALFAVLYMLLQLFVYQVKHLVCVSMLCMSYGKDNQ